MSVDSLNAPSAAGQPLGRVLSVNGSRAIIGLIATGRQTPEEVRATVGKFVGVRAGKTLLVGVITDVTVPVLAAAREQGYYATAEVDLMGEIKDRGEGIVRFMRGVTEYPAINDPADLLGSDALRLLYDTTDSKTIEIGDLQHDHTIGAHIKVEEMLSKHFAILGTTGVGKSSGVALILQELLKARSDLRIFLVDPHNEYGHCFGKTAQVLTPRNLKLPFWLFNFEEIIDVIFGGRPGVEEEVDILSEAIPQAKGAYSQYRGSDRLALKKNDPKQTGYTADTPVPYRLTDLISQVDERMGKLENRSSRMKFFRLIQRIETVRNDPRYAFMFDNANVGGDTMSEVLSQLFRLPPNGVPMTIMQLAGFPAEVVDAVVSVLCRMAFDFGLWSDGAAPLLLVCEEAHRYASADKTIGFGPTRRAISRIAKEGRKYGVFMGLVTQRPAELDPTILSQCSTLFAMRMANDRDQEILRSAVADTAANLLAFLPSLGTREVLAFGEGVALPTRMSFKLLPPDFLRKREVGNVRPDLMQGNIDDFIGGVIERWRGATMSQRPRNDDGFAEMDRFDEAAAPQAPTAQPAPPSYAPPPPAHPARSDSDRFSILKRPIARTEAPPLAPTAPPPRPTVAPAGPGPAQGSPYLTPPRRPPT